MTLSIFYPAVTETIFTESVGYTTTALFNDLGGALGLMLGSTFYTLYEAIDNVIWAAIMWCRMNKRDKSRTVVVTPAPA